MGLLEKFLKDAEYVVEHIVFDKGFSTAVALTNQRLLAIELEKEKKGFGKVQFTPKGLKHNIPLESIKEVLTIQHGRIILDLQIFTDTGSILFKNLVFVSTEQLGKPGIFLNSGMFLKEKIIQQIKDRRQELESKKMPVVIDFSFLKTYIEKGGIVLTTLKCPNCSGPIKIPEGGSEIVCEHCGSTIYAQDVFEKVKKLIE